MNEITEILDDVKNSITGELGIGGSLAQRFLAPELPSLREKPVEKSDLDLLLIPIEGNCEVAPSIKNKFTIIEVSSSNGSYYFGLIHKKTKKWIDLFPKLDTEGLVLIEINGKKYLAESIENQVVYLAKDILRRSLNRLPIRGKWIRKLGEMYGYSGLKKSSLNISEAEIKQALNVRPSSRLRDWLLTARHLFKNRTVTPTGLSAEPSKFFLNF